MRDEGERDERIMALVAAALDQSPEAREGYLRSACGDDTDLFAEVEERVLWEQRMGGFLCQSVIEAFEILDRPFEPGERVADRFRIISEVGRGGMASFTRRSTRSSTGWLPSSALSAATDTSFRPRRGLRAKSATSTCAKFTICTARLPISAKSNSSPWSSSRERL